MNATTAGVGRNVGGRFAKGNPGGPGRPPRATEANYLIALTDVVTVDRWRAIVGRIASQAEAGNLKAAQWLGRLLLGTEPGRLSEAVAGVIHAGPHFRVVEQLDRRERDADDAEEDDEFDPDAELRRVRVRALVEHLGDPDAGAAEVDPDAGDEGLTAARRGLRAAGGMREFTRGSGVLFGSPPSASARW